MAYYIALFIGGTVVAGCVYWYYQYSSKHS